MSHGSEPRYGKRDVPKMIRQVNELRTAIRAEGTPKVQDAWDKVEEHIDFAYSAPSNRALHRSFPEAGDGRPLPPMGDELMSAGLSAEDARFVAVQLAQNGYTLTKKED